jgi:16S rRNA (cytidine1402-2'-O)-methyltransferase
VSTLHIVSTPIGNLGDISVRAGEVLVSVDRILAEDTRRSRVLADHVGSTAPLVSLHAHNEAERIERVLGWLEAGEELALVSDAGTPLVSDPGSRLVTAVAEAGHRVVPIPGASAALAALVASGLPSDQFTFLGFLPRKGRSRADALLRVAASSETCILFESPNRLVKLLEALADSCGADRGVSVAREVTKIHEEFTRGTLNEVASYYRDHPPRGEVTVVVAPVVREAAAEGGESGLVEARQLAVSLADEGMRPSAIVRVLTACLDLARNQAYRIVHETGITNAESGETATDE